MKVLTTLENALVAHQEWKSTLQRAIAAGEELDVKTIERDDCCSLGQWIYGSGRVTYGHFPEFERLLESHKEFHKISSIAAEVINAKKLEQSHAMIGGNSQFAQASSEVLHAIFQLKACAFVGD